MGRPPIEYDIRMRSRKLACTRGEREIKLATSKKKSGAQEGTEAMYTHADWGSDAHLLSLRRSGVDVRTRHGLHL